MKFFFVLNAGISAAFVVFLCLVLRHNYLLGIQEHRKDLVAWELCEQGHGEHMPEGRCEEAKLGLDRPPYIRAGERLMMRQIPETVARASVYVLSNVIRTALFIAVLWYVLRVLCMKLLVLRPKDRQGYWDARDPYADKFPHASGSRYARDDHYESHIQRRGQKADV